MACRSGCPTKDHATWGECARAARFQIDRHALTHSLRAERDKDRRLATYEQARRDGLQPRTTQWADVRDCLETGGVEKTPVAAPGSVAVTANPE